MAWETLEIVGKSYHSMYRNFRKAYKWAPEVVDKLDIRRILRIHEELVEDSQKKETTALDEEDFE
jgi:hypothetical protein